MSDTIYALSTPPGNGVAVIRISGPQALDALRQCFSRRGIFVSHMLYYGYIRDMRHSNTTPDVANDAPVADSTPIDEAMAVWMQAPRSYTGEDCAELHCHGSLAVLRQVLALLSSLGYRQAEPGEFSRRAFENGRMDLSQAEAVMDLIEASVKDAADAALAQLEGRLGRTVRALQDRLTDAIAELEAVLDYPEEDWEQGIQIFPAIQAVREEMCALLATGGQGRMLREGVQVALVGRPNAGKSTLMNALLGSDRAIVTHIPGTTRDVLEEGLNIGGLPVRLYDTAGLRESGDLVERIGIERSRRTMAEADIVLLLLDASADLTEEDTALLREQDKSRCIVVLSKGDLPQCITEAQIAPFTHSPVVTIAAKEEQGLGALQDALLTLWQKLSPQGERSGTLVSNQRHLDALTQGIQAVDAAVVALQDAAYDCASVDLRDAWRALGEITGETVDESIIDRIFARFCLGK